MTHKNEKYKLFIPVEDDNSINVPPKMAVLMNEIDDAILDLGDDADMCDYEVGAYMVLQELLSTPLANLYSKMYILLKEQRDSITKCVADDKAAKERFEATEKQKKQLPVPVTQAKEKDNSNMSKKSTKANTKTNASPSEAELNVWYQQPHIEAIVGWNNMKYWEKLQEYNKHKSKDIPTAPEEDISDEEMLRILN